MAGIILRSRSKGTRRKSMINTSIVPSPALSFASNTTGISPSSVHSPPMMAATNMMMRNNPQHQQQQGSVSFKIHIHTVQVKLTSDTASVINPELLQLSINFANFKQFLKQPLSIIHENNNNNNRSNNSTPLPHTTTTTTNTTTTNTNTVLDWEFDRQFLYETRAIQFMHLKHLTIQLIHSNTHNNDSNTNKLISEIKTDLYTLACGPTHHELELVDQNENKKIGTIVYHITMEQVSEVQLCVRSISISVNVPIECYLIYKHSGRNAKAYRTDISQNMVSPFWHNLEPLWFTGTLKELVRQSIFIQVVQKIHQQFVTVAKCHIPLFRVISIINNQAVPFNGSILFNEMIHGTFNCLVESRNVPVFAQLTHGKHVGYGIVGGTAFFPGVKIPTIPHFPNDYVAQQYYHQKKQRDLLDMQENQVPSFDPKQFRMDTDEESTQTTTNRELSQLLSQSNSLKLSNDRLSVKYDNLLAISAPSCVKSSSCIFDLNDQYFEVTILDSGVRDLITVGLSSQSFSYHMQPGSNDASYGFESKTGNKLFSGQSNLYSSPFTVGDTIGCGISPEGAIYFTRNGQFLGEAFYPVTITNKDLFCTVALHSHYARVRVNFGHERFKFNLENAKLPSGWKLHDSVDRFGRFFFTSADNSRTFVDPRINPAIWKEQNETAERLCNTLMKPLMIKFSAQGNMEKLDKAVKWNGIKSERIINALRMIPRSAFVPEELVPTANIGQHMSADINDIPFDLTSTMVIARALDELQLRPGSKFLEIGSGCGYMTTLAGFIVGDKGVACGMDINERIIEFSRNKLLEFMKQTGLSLQSITFIKRNLFQSTITNAKLRKEECLPSKVALTAPPVISTLSVSADEYDAIFCGLEVQRNQFNNFRSLLKTGGSVVTCVDNTLVRLRLNKNLDWEEEIIMTLSSESISQIILPTEMERRIEKIDALKEGLLQMGFNLENIQAAMTHLGYTIHAAPNFDFDDANRQLTLLNYCHLAQHPNLSRFNFSPEEIIDAIESFPAPFQATASTEALIYLSNTRIFSSMYQIPTKQVRELFQVMHCNLESIQRFLSDAKYCRQQLQKYQTSSNTQHELTREIFQDLIAFNNVDTAMAHLVKKYSSHRSSEQ